jgi:DNA-binding NarL/FixJ family response regulator
MAIRIVLVEDHTIVRAGLRRLLEVRTGYEVVGETSDGLEAIRLVETLNPDIVILDLMLPGLGGLEVSRRLSKGSPDTKIVVLSMHSDESYVSECMNGGASAYVLKDSDSEELFDAIAAVRAGRRYWCKHVRTKTDVRPSENPFDRLTDRERQVLRLVAHGMTSAHVAHELSISPRTVETHRAHVLRKLGLTNQTDLVRFAIKHGMIQP